jgi:hypothetical protein
MSKLKVFGSGSAEVEMFLQNGDTREFESALCKCSITPEQALQEQLSNNSINHLWNNNPSFRSAVQEAVDYYLRVLGRPLEVRMNGPYTDNTGRKLEGDSDHILRW